MAVVESLADIRDLDPYTEYPDIVDFFATKDIGVFQAHLRAESFRLALHPKINFDDGVLDEVKKHRDQDGRIVIVANHVSMFDPFHVATMLERNRKLRSMVGSTVIPFRVTNLQTPMLGKELVRMGGIPALRLKDYRKFKFSDAEESGSLSVDDNVYFAKCSKRFVEAAVNQIVQMGHNFFIFPQGEREKNSPLTINQFEKGLGIIVQYARKALLEQRAGTPNEGIEPLAFLCVGIHYPKLLGHYMLMRPTLQVSYLPWDTEAWGSAPHRLRPVITDELQKLVHMAAGVDYESLKTVSCA